MGNKNRNQSTTTDDKKEAAAASTETLLGSNTQPAMVKVAGFEVELGQAVKGAFDKSGLTVAEWNALTQDAREGFIAAVIDAQPEQAGDRGEAGALDAASLPTQGDETLNQDLGASNVVSADADGVATAASLDEQITGDQAALEEAGAIDESLVEDTAHPPPSVALINGVLHDYERIMGEGKQPHAHEGVRAQQSLLRILRALTGDTRDAASEGVAAIKTFFVDHQDSTASEAHLARFVSGDDLELLLKVRAYALQK